MNKTLLALLVTGFVLGGAGTAIAGDTVTGSATEHDPYCETRRNGAAKDYDGIGWSTGPGGNSELGGESGYIPPDWEPLGAGGPIVNVCEGEHWDGEDTVQPGQNNQGDCVGVIDGNVALFQCSDPNDEEDVQVLTPVSTRLSWIATGDSNAVYMATHISGVGQAAVFVSNCQSGGEQLGHTGGNTACEGTVGENAVGIYLIDNTPFQLNILASVVSAARLTKGYVSDGDCTQEEYEASAYLTNNGEEPTCGRDNTAITAEFIL